MIAGMRRRVAITWEPMTKVGNQAYASRIWFVVTHASYDTEVSACFAVVHLPVTHA